MTLHDRIKQYEEMDGKRTNTSACPDGFGGKDWLTNKFGTQVLSENSYELICEMPNMNASWPYGSEKFERHIADAQFIAAAPAMHADLQNLYGVVEQLCAAAKLFSCPVNCSCDDSLSEEDRFTCGECELEQALAAVDEVLK